MVIFLWQTFDQLANPFLIVKYAVFTADVINPTITVEKCPAIEEEFQKFLYIDLPRYTISIYRLVCTFI